MADESQFKLSDLVGKVCDEESFLNFVNALMNDRLDEVEKEKTRPTPPYGPGANGWENGTIEGFLEAGRAWAIDSKFGRKTAENKFDGNCWNQFARFLYAGKCYE